MTSGIVSTGVPLAGYLKLCLTNQKVAVEWQMVDEGIDFDCDGVTGENNNLITKQGKHLGNTKVLHNLPKPSLFRGLRCITFYIQSGNTGFMPLS